MLIQIEAGFLCRIAHDTIRRFNGINTLFHGSHPTQYEADKMAVGSSCGTGNGGWLLVQ